MAVAMALAPSSSSPFLSPSRRRRRPPPRSDLLLRISSWDDWRSSSRLLSRIVESHCFPRPLVGDPLFIRSEIAGQYEDNFADVDKHLLDYFTYKAVRTVLVQLYEMNPTQYSWFYNFVVDNKPQDSKAFLRTLVKERQELCERVMVTRLHLYNKWIKKHDHGKMYQSISDQNLELLREHLVQTVKWSSDADDKKEA